MIRVILLIFVCCVICGCKSPCTYCGKESYLKTNTFTSYGKQISSYSYKACEACIFKVCFKCHRYAPEGLLDSLCASCRRCWLCGKTNCTIVRMGGKWVCDSHYCTVHNHGFEKDVRKGEPCCPQCYKEQQEQEAKLAEERRQKERSESLARYKKARAEEAELKRKMDAVKIDSILGVHFGDKYPWVRDKPISTQAGGGKATISFEKPFRCFTTAEIFATPMGRAYSLRAERKFDVVSRSNLEREQMAIAEMLEKKFGICFPGKSNPIAFENDNVEVVVGICTFNNDDGGAIWFCITNKTIRNEDNKSFLEKGFKPADKEDGVDLL